MLPLFKTEANLPFHHFNWCDGGFASSLNTFRVVFKTSELIQEIFVYNLTQ